MDEMSSAEWRELMGLPPAGSLPEVRELPGNPVLDAVSIIIYVSIPRELSPNWSPQGTTDAWRIKKRHADKLADITQHTLANFQVTVPSPVTIGWWVYHGKGRQLQDRNNLLGGGLKRIQDEIVRAGIIEDDSPDILLDATLEQYLWKEHKQSPHVEVLIKHVRREQDRPGVGSEVPEGH
jgi:hypothetical protein